MNVFIPGILSNVKFFIEPDWVKSQQDAVEIERRMMQQQLKIKAEEYAAMEKARISMVRRFKAQEHADRMKEVMWMF